MEQATPKHEQSRRQKNAPAQWGGSIFLSLALHTVLFFIASFVLIDAATPPLGSVQKADAEPPLLYLFQEPPPAPVPPLKTEPAPSVQPIVEELKPQRPDAGDGSSFKFQHEQVAERSADELYKTSEIASKTPALNEPAHAPMKRQTGMDAPVFKERPNADASEIQRMEWPTQEGMNAENRTAIGRAPKLYAAGRRTVNGAGGAGGASYGPGSNAQPSYMVDPYRGIMKKLAEGIVQSTEAEKLDIVLIVDTTGSMEDNVRGVRAYADQFARILRLNKRDAHFGLVTFTDASHDPPKTMGMTDNAVDLRNWLNAAKFTGGGGLAESGLEAVMAALNEFRYRDGAKKRFIFISDGPFHDRDYNGASDLTMDAVIDTLKQRRVTLDSVSIDFLLTKQLAWGTGGQWTRIPGKGHLEQFIQPLPVQSNAALGVLSTKAGSASDEIYVFVPPDQQIQWYQLTWRLLNPRGEKIQGEFTDRRSAVGQRKIVFRPQFDPEWFSGLHGAYTAIYRVTDSAGNSSSLRRIMDYR